MPPESRRVIERIPDFDVLYEDIEKGGQIVKEKLNLAGFKRVKLVYHASIGEVIPESYEIQVNEDTVAFIYKPNACFSYNIVNLDKQRIKVASIDTMLFLCYSFYYSNQPYYFRERILCTIKILSDVEIQNRLNQKGLLKRFSTECIGEHLSFMQIKEQKALKFKELVKRRHTREYSEWFLKYNPLLHSRPAFMRKRRPRFERVRSSLKKTRRNRPPFLNTRRWRNRGVGVAVRRDAMSREPNVSPTPPSFVKKTDKGWGRRGNQGFSTDDRNGMNENSEIDNQYDTIEEYSRRDTPFPVLKYKKIDNRERKDQPNYQRKHRYNNNGHYGEEENIGEPKGRNAEELERETNADELEIDELKKHDHKKRRKHKKQTNSYGRKMFDLQRLLGYRGRKTKKTRKGFF
jgi:hypothetical protein